MDKIWETLSYKRRDLSNCESEPIQYCGAIQSCGWFLAIDEISEQITAASANCTEIFDLSSSELIGCKLTDLITTPNHNFISLGEAINLSRSSTIAILISKSNKVLNAHFSKCKDFVCVDIEPIVEHTDSNSSRLIEQLRRIVVQADLDTELEVMLDRAAAQIRNMIGFDRVMIYRFEPNWDGYVIAESARNDLEKFHGLYYPASDIPAQARKLYSDSPYRMIVDVDSIPSPIETRKGLGRSELDLSASALRAVSPFHIQYLKNMGVKASFSVSIKVNGNLWGLIACHHYQGAKFISRELRSTSELAGQILSGRILDYINDRQLTVRNQILLLSQSILDQVTEGQSALSSFKQHAQELIEATESNGVYVHLAGESIRIGTTPSEEYIKTLFKHLSNLKDVAIWKSENVAKDLNIPVDTNGVGVLAVPLSFGFEDCIIWFRPEFKRIVNWGGNPSHKSQPGEILSPRASFASWSEKVEGRSREWSESAQEAGQHILFTFVRGIFKKASELSKANVEMARVTKAKDEFIGMVSHELRTPLGVMIGWIDILRDELNSNSTSQQALEIIDRNAKLQINLINDLLDVSRIISGKMRINPVENVSIKSLIEDVLRDLQPTANTKDLRLGMHLESDVIASFDPDRMRQIIWNLISNSIKFTPKGGRIDVEVNRVRSSYELTVRDNGIGIEKSQLNRIFDRFAQVSEGTQRSGGLGLGLSIVKALVELHGGVISVQSLGKDRGSTFTASFPVFIISSKNGATDMFLPSRGEASVELLGLKILLVEDIEDAANALELTLKRLGAQVKIATNGRLGFERFLNEPFDLILSDIGMPEMDGLEMLKKIRGLELDRRVGATPAIALTAYASPKERTQCLEAGFQSHIAKPVDRAELIAVIKSLQKMLAPRKDS